MNFYELIREIKNLNMGAEIRVGSPLYDPLATDRIFCSVPGDELNLPEGYYPSFKNEIKSDESEYNTIMVEDISKAKEYAHDILEVGLDGLTNEERESVNKKSFKDRIREKLVNGRDRFVLTMNNQGDKFVNKISGLFNRIKNKIKYSTSKRANVDLKAELDAKNQEKQLDDRALVKSILKSMENDEYILGRIKSELGSSIQDAYVNNPSALVNTLKDYELIRVLHNFAKNDAAYNEGKFRMLSTKALDIKEENSLKINRLIQIIRYGNIEENQMQFLEEQLLEIEKKLETPVKQSNVEETVVSNNQTAPTVTITKADKRKEQIDKEFSEKKAELFNKLGDYEKAFIDDAASESLEPGDNEFNMMMNERAIDKNAVLSYLRSLEDLKQEMAKKATELQFNDLGDYEKMFVEDAKAESLNPNDNEFNMMINERAVNKQDIFDYYNGIDNYNKKVEESNKRKDKIDSLSLKDKIVESEEKVSSLDNFEKMAVEDAKAETLKPGDNEYNQMMNERTVNREKVDFGYEQLEEIKKMRERLEKLSRKSTVDNEESNLEESSGRSL